MNKNIDTADSFKTFWRVRCLIKPSHNFPVWPPVLTSDYITPPLLTRSIIQQCAGHPHPRGQNSRDILGNSSHLTQNHCLNDNSEYSRFWSLVISRCKCHYRPGWAATLRLEEITKRWLGARFRDYSGPVHCRHSGRCELRDNHLSTECLLCTAWPAAQDWLLLPWAVSRHTPPTPTPTTQPGIQRPLKERYIVSICRFFPVFSC